MGCDDITTPVNQSCSSPNVNKPCPLACPLPPLIGHPTHSIPTTDYKHKGPDDSSTNITRVVVRLVGNVNAEVHASSARLGVLHNGFLPWPRISTTSPLSPYRSLQPRDISRTCLQPSP